MLNLAGDISNKDLKETGMFKACTGRSLLGGRRKFLNNINFENYAKFIFACNELPMVYDSSRGFWDRWILLEFPFTFVPKDEYDRAEDKSLLKIRDEEIIQKIVTPEELSGFLNECLNALDRLLKQRHFSTTEGSEEVKTKWIRKSNSFMAFCLDKLEGCYEGKIRKRDLRQCYSNYCKEHKLVSKSDIVIKIVLQELYGVVEERIETSELNIRDWYWLGVKFK
jgi:putative DNA primase/helicase